MVSLFPLSAVSFRYFISAVEYKLQNVEQQARLDMQSSSAPVLSKEFSVKKNRIINWIEPIVECLESLLKAFLGSSYNDTSTA